MLRGILTGSLAGLIMGAVGISTASLLAPARDGGTLPDAPMTTADAGSLDGAGDAPAATMPGDTAQPATAPAPADDSLADDSATIATAPQVAPPLTANLPQLAETRPPAMPSATGLSGAMQAPQAGVGPALPAMPEEPVLPNPLSVAPQVPPAEGGVVVATQPAAPTRSESVAANPEAAPRVDTQVPAIATPTATATTGAPPPRVVATPAAPQLAATDAAPVIAATDTGATAADPLPQTAPTVALAPQAPTPAALATPDTPVRPDSETIAPSAPAGDAVEAPVDLAVLTPRTVAEPPVTRTVPVAERPDMPSPADIPVAPAALAPAQPPVSPATAPADAPAVDTPEAEATDITAPDIAAPAMVEDPPLRDSGAAEPATRPAADSATAPPPVPAPTVTPDTATGTEVTLPEVAESPAEPAPESAPVSIIDTTGNALPAGAGSVRVNRRFGQDAATEETPLPTAPMILPDSSIPPLQRHAAQAPAGTGLPRAVLVLIDDGSLPGGPQLLTGLPMQVTVALDPSDPGAATRMAAYRAAGIEVTVTTRLPTGATASDAAVSMEAAFATLPQTTALILTQPPGARGVTDQIIGTLAADGRGLAALEQGLGRTIRSARSAGVPAAAVLRDLDGNGQDAAVIRRFLDNAAFRARQGDRVVLVGRMRPDTLSALNVWGAAARADQVSFVPLSALLLQQQ